MRSSFWLMLALTALAHTGCGGNPIPSTSTTVTSIPSPPSPPTPPAPAPVEVAITDGVLEIQGQKITDESKLADLEKVLGKASNVEKGGFNWAAIWDDLGLYVIVAPESTTVLELTFYLGSTPRIYRPSHPKQRFTGKFALDGAEIKKDSDMVEVARTKKGPPIEPMEGKGHSWSIKRKGRGPAVGIETEDDKGKGVRIVYYTF